MAKLKEPTIIHLALVPNEGWALLRALALAGESSDTPAGDKGPIKWVANRLLTHLHTIGEVESK